MTGVRFTAWLDAPEREKLRARAHENGCSENLVLRMALREALGLPVPQWAWPLIDHHDEHELREAAEGLSARRSGG